MHTLKAKTWVNADSTKVAEEGSAEAAWLLGVEGDEISDETAERLGLAGGDAYSSMKVAELRSLAEDRGVGLDEGAKKADIIAALEAADEERTADVASSATADVASASEA